MSFFFSSSRKKEEENQREKKNSLSHITKSRHLKVASHCFEKRSLACSMMRSSPLKRG